MVESHGYLSICKRFAKNLPLAMLQSHCQRDNKMTIKNQKKKLNPFKPFNIELIINENIMFYTT